MEVDPDLIPTTSAIGIKRDVEDIQGQYTLCCANVSHNCKPRSQKFSFNTEIYRFVVKNHCELNQRVEEVKLRSKGIHVVKIVSLFNKM